MKSKIYEYRYSKFTDKKEHIDKYHKVFSDYASCNIKLFDLIILFKRIFL